jgi:hypothetical protein
LVKSVLIERLNKISSPINTIKEEGDMQTFKDYIISESEVKISFDKRKLKVWGATVINPSEDFNEYDDKKPKDWDVDEFVSYFNDQITSQGFLSSSSELSSMIKYKNSTSVSFWDTFKNGCGFNKDFYWNKFKSNKSIIYDLFEEIKKYL